MPSAQGLLSKINSVMNRVNLTERQVFKRSVIKRGGDPLLGRGVSVSNEDTLLTPQPVVQNPIATGPVVLSGSAINATGDYIMTVSVSAMSRSEVTDSNVVIVFKNADAQEEVFHIAGFEPLVFQGQDIGFTCALVSKKR